MALNARDGFSSALTLFSSLYEDMNPTDLPEGLSPDNQDVWFLPGSVSTRPALSRYLTDAVSGAPQLLSEADFPLPSGEHVAIFLDANGVMRQRNPDGSTTQLITINTPGGQFKSATAFDKQFYAFYDATRAAEFSETPFVGVDIPRYFDGQNFWRVTQDAPGVPPTFTTATITAASIAAAGLGSAKTITSITPTDPHTTTFKPGISITFYATFEVLTATAHGLSVGESVVIAGNTRADFNATWTVKAVIDATHYKVSYNNDDNTVGTGGTSTALAPSLVRMGNIVTATTSAPHGFQVGFQVAIAGIANTNLGGGITAMARYAGGVVNVITANPHGLAPGDPFTIAGSTSPDTSFNGDYTVVSVLSATEFSFSQPGLTPEFAGVPLGNVQDNWNGNVIILSVPSSTSFTYFQLGAEDFTSTSGTATPVPLMAGGVRNAVVMFKSFNGAITAPSVPVAITGNGVAYLLAQNIPIGPPGTAQRVIAFTPAFGANYYYLSPGFVPGAAGQPPLFQLGTIINDNTSTSALMDFSDVALVSGTQIDIAGNDLFAQVVLAPCLGVIEYQGRLGWWGEINNIKSNSNWGFDGGFLPTSATSGTAQVIAFDSVRLDWISGTTFDASWVGVSILLNGAPFTIVAVVSSTQITLNAIAAPATYNFQVVFPNGRPLGWASNLSTGGSGTLIFADTKEEGFAYQMTAAGGDSDAEIDTSGYEDYFGAPILIPETTYIGRILLKAAGTAITGGSVIVRFQSLSLGLYAQVSIDATKLTGKMAWYSALANGPMPAVIPSDMRVALSLSGVDSGAIVTADEVELIDSAKPVLAQQMRVSYFNNEFGYDDVTGIIGDEGPALLTAAFKQRGVLFMLTDQATGSMFRTQNNGSTEPNDWAVDEFAEQVDCAGPNAVDEGEGVAWWAGQSGMRIFAGDQPKKLSQEIQTTWQSIDWTKTLSLFVANDPIQRIVYVGGAAIGKVLPMSYRSVNTALEPADPLHVSYSGKLICSDLCRKWTRWNIPPNCAAMLTVGNASQMIFGAGFGQLYSLGFAKYTDDDYGAIVSYYTTYFHWNHDMEQSTPLLGLHRKLYQYLSAYVTGIGNLTITPLVDSLNNPWQPKSSVWNPTLKLWQAGAVAAARSQQLTNGVLAHDLDFRLNVLGDRVAFKIAVSPLNGQTDAYFNLQHLVVSGRMDRIMPVRGAYL